MELLKGTTVPLAGGIQVLGVGVMPPGVVLEARGSLVKPPGFLREGGGHQEPEVKGRRVETGVGAPVLWGEVIQ